MKHIMILVLVTALCGCYDGGPEGLTNKEIIAGIKECTEAGLGSTDVINGLNFNVVRIRCTVPHPCKD